MNRPRGLFVNSPAAQCSIHESGRMFHAALARSTRFELDYIEAEWIEDLPAGYDFYAINYHFLTLARFDTVRARDLPGLTMAFVLELLPGDPFLLCPDHFDVYCAIDPTMDIADPRVYGFPRPLEPTELLPAYVDRGVPVIGSFGFATPGKGFHRIVQAASDEFERAIVRLHLPTACHADIDGAKAQKIVDQCRAVAGPGIEIQVSNDYKSKHDLVAWCAENTINCFFYERKIPGLAATVDQAVMSGRPLLVSGADTFRHVHHYVRPWPEQSIAEAIASSGDGVAAMQQDWAQERFLGRFEAVLCDQHLLEPNVPDRAVIIPDTREHVLFLNHKQQACGIQQYGKNSARALQASRRFDVEYVEVESLDEFRAAAADVRPSAVIYNYHFTTMPWVTSTAIHEVDAVHVGVVHEFRPRFLDAIGVDVFDHLVVGDPTLDTQNPHVSRIGRIVPDYANPLPEPAIPTIGSFGFGFPDKGFEHLTWQVQTEFERAILRFHMPLSRFSDPDGELCAATVGRCRQLITKPGIELVVSHDFVDDAQLLAFLADNSINAFFYDVHKNFGISSCPDLALAVGRPIAISRCPMFRHLFGVQPSICIEDRSLREIMASGPAPLAPLAGEWTTANFVRDYELILDGLLASRTSPIPLGSPAACAAGVIR